MMRRRPAPMTTLCAMMLTFVFAIGDAQGKQLDLGASEPLKRVKAKSERDGPTYGPDETLVSLLKTDITDQNGGKLYLAHKITTHINYFANSLTDDGYVLGIEGSRRYYPLPPQRRDQLQEQGLLPRPLPPYQISWIYLAFAHPGWIIIGVLTLCLALFLFVLGQRLRTSPLIDEGDTHLAAGRLDEAIESYSKAMAKTSFTDARFLRAGAYRAKGDLLKAIDEYALVSKEELGNAEALYRRAIILAELDRLDEALTDLNEAVKLDQSKPEILIARGKVQTAKGALGSALADFSAALVLTGGRADILTERAALFERLGDNEKAAADRGLAAHLEKAQAAAGA